jgi:uncharacterized membrane protein
VLVLYPVLPWIGVIALGYGFSEAYTWAAERRRALLVRLAVAMVVVFVVLRYASVYGDPLPWSPQASAMKTLMSFFNVQKYGPSLLYVLATLAPAMLTLGLLDGRTITGGPGGALVTLGRVPLFFYMLQWLTAHLCGIAITAWRGGTLAPYFMSFVEQFAAKEPFVTGGPLWLTYVCWAAATVLLYFPCRWFARVKATRRDWWLGYL